MTTQQYTSGTLKPNWYPEVIRRGTDRLAGARIFQLTSTGQVSHNFYCEERYGTVDGARIAFARSSNGYWPLELWACDLRTQEVCLLCDALDSFPTSNLYCDTLFFSRRVGDSRLLTRLDLRTLEIEAIFDLNHCPKSRYTIGTVSRDERYFVGNYRVSADTWGLYRVDLPRGSWEPFHEHRDICNPHQQFEPSRGDDLLVQLNTGCVLDAEENIVELVGEAGATLYVIDRDGGNIRYLPVGRPHSRGVTGHECWVADTGIVLNTESEEIGCSVRTVRPGDVQAKIIWQGRDFTHISASSEGNYFVVDDMANGLVYVGNLATGKLLPLCDSGASCSPPQHAHPHPYMTPDNRHVIYNSDSSGIGQVCAAEIPRGFLPALDVPA